MLSSGEALVPAAISFARTLLMNKSKWKRKAAMLKQRERITVRTDLLVAHSDAGRADEALTGDVVTKKM